MPEPAIYVENLRKVYSTVVAVDNLSFEVPRGQIFGLLGPNGAGKTTTIRMLMDMIHPDSGTARVLGMPPGEARQRVGYLPEERGLYRTLRVTDCLVYLGQLKGMHTADARKEGENERRLATLSAWRETPFFTDRESAALAWTEALTLVADGHVPDEVWNQVHPHFSESELADLTLLVVAINGWNRFSIAFRKTLD